MDFGEGVNFSMKLYMAMLIAVMKKQNLTEIDIDLRDLQSTDGNEILIEEHAGEPHRWKVKIK